MVSVDQVREWGDSAIWIDARPDDEFARDHVPGAISLNEDHWNELLPQFLAAWSPGKKVVVYCSAQSCDLAREVAERLRKEAQLPDVFVLAGGWEAWGKKDRWRRSLVRGGVGKLGTKKKNKRCFFLSACSSGGLSILLSPQFSSMPACL